jgi:RNA polymerase sigma-70 factor (ECF subfamily)
VVLGAAAGDAAQREAFARRYGPVVRAFLGARWRRGPLSGEIDDAAQEVFLDCFRAGGALARVDATHEGGFRAFLFGVVRNVARRFEQRRARTRERAAEDLLDAVAPDDSPSRAFDRAWARATMLVAREIQADRAAGDAEALRRVVLLRLRFLEGMPMREFAAAWGTDARRLQYEYRKARDEFEAALHEAVRRHHPDAAVDAEAARLIDLLA